MPTGNGPKVGELRRAQLVSTHGPGAVVDYLAANNAPVSCVTLGLDAWDRRECRRIVEPVLERLLGVSALYEPPVSFGRADGERVQALPSARFPKWLECPECNSLRHQGGWSTETGGAGLFCQYCTNKTGRTVYVLPARLMVICQRGHLNDFPWLEWIEDCHADGCRKSGKLKLRSRGAGLRNLYVNCADCGKGSSLRDAFTKVHQMSGGCRGGRPWLGDGDDASETCDASAKEVATALRGSSNLYFPHVASVLTIPPWSDSFREKLEEHDLWSRIRDALADFAKDGEARYIERAVDMTARRLAELTDFSVADAHDRLNAMIELLERLPDADTSDSDIAIRREEWHQFRDASAAPSETFEVREEAVPDVLAPWLSAIVRVPRLREVRALKGFTRRYPPDGTADQTIAPLSRRASWRPAIATSGEGVFLALDERRVADWEAKEAVETRARRLHEAWVAAWRKRFDRPDETPPRSVTARSLLVHGLSHALMLELSITSGYGSASLLERLYADADGEPMAGVLLYTATSDNEGTLGGLEREGMSNRIAGTVKRALRRLEWCSSDPLCMSGVSTTSDPLNGAACHSCLFVPETACELFNQSLDRAVLIGGAGVPGFFEELLSRQAGH